jgi:membrane fusion protein (multidrug efflux system)
METFTLNAPADLEAALAGAGGRAQPGQAVAAVLSASNQRAATEAQIAAARADEARARADLQRYERLAVAHVISQQQLDASRTAAQTATANREALERQAAAAGASVTNARAGVRLAQARVAAAQSARDNAALQLSYTQLRAPTAGIVSKRSVEPGQLVQPGQQLLSIVADTGVYITANLKETQLDQVRVGQPVDVEVDAYGDCQATGRVQSISGATGARFALLPPDNATGNFTKVVQRLPVRIGITRGCGRDRPLRPGMSVEVHVRTR